MAGPTSSEPAAKRAQAALAGHTGNEAVARRLVNDPSAEVRASALGALERLQQLRPADIVAALADPDPGVRRRAAELAAQHADVDLIGTLSDPAPLVAEMAAWAMGEQPAATATAVETLAAMATTHTDPLCREAAVAALGAIGMPGGLAAILVATADKPAVRRRAVIALAAFDGPEVDAALQRALTDRDWQVRQAAEDQLDTGA